MNLKPIGIVLFAVALAGLAVFFVYKQRNSNHWENYRPSVQQKFLNFPADGVARLSFRNGNEEVILLKKDGTWSTEAEGIEVDSAKIDAFLAYLADAKASEYSKAIPSQLAELRLVLPGKESWAGGGILVTFQDANGAALTTLLLGKKLYPPNDRSEAGVPLGRYVCRLSSPNQQPDEVALLTNPLDVADKWFKFESPSQSEPVSVEKTVQDAVQKAIQSVKPATTPPAPAETGHGH